MPVIEQNPDLARALLSQRDAIARRLIQSICLYPRWKAMVDSGNIDGEHDLTVFVDYLIKAFERGDEDYLFLYAGEKLKLRYDKNIDPDLLAEIFAAELETSRKVFCESVSGRVSGTALGVLSNALCHIEKILTSQTQKTLKMLWVADCIYLDIQAFLLQKAADLRVSLDVTLVTTKNAALRRQEIQKLARENKFDLVFYSPLSYQLNRDFAQFQSARAILLDNLDKRRIVSEALHEISVTLDCIVENVECDVFIHNTAGLVRSENTLKARARFHFTSGARKLTREMINPQIAELVGRRNQTAFGSVRLIDEMQLVEKAGEWQASQYMHKSPFQHPARLGALLASVYADIVFAEAYLKPIKLIVADLDNTLWDGVIGEGDVVHFLDRQKTLRLLKEKGLLLSINSKNDAKNVHWRGAVLDDSDFVSRQINWNPKAQNMQRIQRELNLKFGSFLFLDDRAEEREMVQTAIPDILSLDSDSPDTWRRLAVWADIAKNPGELDRTQMYIERTQRESFASVDVDADALLAQLELEVRIQEAQQSELPRVTELINRTNQFNCCNSRVTFREIQSWSKDQRWKIYVADARDRFGQMGIVSVLVARIDAEIIDIESFVLSCRVFGYGIEASILKRLADDHKDFQIRGRIVETLVNEPCRAVYKENGFTDQGDNVWLLRPGSEITLKPWLKVGS